jgi:type II secretory pathway pseudopilin PulG
MAAAAVRSRTPGNLRPSPIRSAPIGLTLVELLVVVSIIAMIAALLLPAVQAAREAARRMQCGNNLKQVGMALQSYADVHGSLPPGNITMGPCCNTPTQTVWSVSILPYLELRTLLDLYDARLPLEDAGHAQLRSQQVAVYNCPSDSQAGRLLTPAAGPHQDQVWMTSSYRGMSGASWYAGSAYSYRKHWDSSDILDPLCPRQYRGALHWVGRVNDQSNEYDCERLSHITDGLSNTLLVGEYTTKTSPRRTTFWAYGYTSFALSCMTPESRTLIADFDKCAKQGDAGPCKRAFGSLHDGGVIQFLKCDGSVMAISPGIDRSCYGAMATIAGGDSMVEMSR